MTAALASALSGHGPDPAAAFGSPWWLLDHALVAAVRWSRVAPAWTR
ncbi:hypothetical protein [Streptomyces sp. IMTB 2501]|nr:hypothetical protein [Streptomyces sp. IMTB 2501]